MKDFLKIMIASALGFLIAQILISIIAMVMFIGAAGSIFSSMSSEKFVLQNNSVLNLRLDGTIVERVADPDPFTSMLSSQYPSAMRSEERRVGKECRSRWWPEHYKKKRMYR